MRGLKYLLLSASAAAATTFLPTKPEGYHHGHVIEGRRIGLAGEEYETSTLVWPWGEDSGELAKRQTSQSNITQFCRFWGQSSAMVNDKLYISGGIATFRENFRQGWLYLFSSAIMVDLGGGVAFPVIGNDSALLSYLAVNAQMGSTQMGAFWWDGANTIFKYGGWFADSHTWPNTPQARVREAQLWELDITTSTWQMGTMPSSIHRAWGGAVASYPDKKVGYFLGGIVENRTDTAFTNAPGYEYLGDSFLNFDSSSATLSNKTYSTAGASSLGSIGLGNLVYISGMGKEGILVFIGGAQGPSEAWVPTGTLNGVQLRDMDVVWIHDIANNRWYEQNTTLGSGTQGPTGRISACAVVVPASDETSWNIFVYGGGDLDPSGNVYGDTWVLSLPSFTWIQVDNNGDKRFEHTCHLTKGNQMLVVGGRDKAQASAGNPAKNYTTTTASAWTCLQQGLLSSFDLNAFAWGNSLQASNVGYQVNGIISSVIGGNAKGGATKVTPDGGWNDAALGSLMKVTTPTSTSTPKSGGGGTSVGPIVGGVVGGIVVIALIAFGLIYLRRQKKKKAAEAAAAAAAATAAETAQVQQQPPAGPYDPRQSGLYNTTPAPQYWPHANQAPPGYVWDPHSGQYYLPVPTPAPQSPPVDSYYKPNELPKTEPVEMEQAPHVAPQELHG